MRTRGTTEGQDDYRAQRTRPIQQVADTKNEQTRATPNGKQCIQTEILQALPRRKVEWKSRSVRMCMLGGRERSQRLRETGNVAHVVRVSRVALGVDQRLRHYKSEKEPIKC
jgi:hypothetical protein